MDQGPQIQSGCGVQCLPTSLPPELLKVGIPVLPFSDSLLGPSCQGCPSPPAAREAGPDAHPLPLPPPLSTTQTSQLEGIRHREQPLSPTHLRPRGHGAWSVFGGRWDSVWWGLVSENQTGAHVCVYTHTHAAYRGGERLTGMCAPAVGAAGASEAEPGVRRERGQKREEAAWGGKPAHLYAWGARAGWAGLLSGEACFHRNCLPSSDRAVFPPTHCVSEETEAGEPHSDWHIPAGTQLASCTIHFVLPTN